MKDTKGITLLVLIITVIILLILATITINGLTGKESVIDNAEEIAQRHNEQAEEEEQAINQVKQRISNSGRRGGSSENDIDTSKDTVYGSLYKISDNEYHLIFNRTGNLAQGYTQEQFIGKSGNIANGSSTNPYWATQLDKITKCKIEEEINPTSTAYYFYNLSEITEIEGIENINTNQVTNLSAMFCGCSSLTYLDLSSFNTGKVTDITYLFYNCLSLSQIYVGNSFILSTEINSTKMFTNCSNLVGGAGTTYDANHVDAEYARVDGGESSPGYFTYKGN